MNTKEVAQQIIKLAKAERVEFAEAVVIQNEFLLKRIKKGQVDQPPAGEQWAIDIALTKDKRRKAVTFDNPVFAQQIIRETVEQMSLLPKHEVRIPSEVFPPVPQPEHLYDEQTAALKGEHLIAIAKEIHEKLQAHDLFLSGKLAQSRGEITYTNSLGTSQTAAFTLAVAGLFAFGEKNLLLSAYANSGGTSVEHIERHRIIKELLLKCELQKGKEKIDLFADKPEGEDLRIDTICEPYFFGPLFEWLGFFGFNGLFVERGESFISNKIGQEVTGPNITIADNPNEARNNGIGLPFDFEGRPRSPTVLIAQGKAKAALYDSELARKWQKQPTGNALPPSGRSGGAAPFNLVIEGGNTSVEEMIQNSKEPTLWITKLHYPGMKHYQTATMTGVAQHGVFLVQEGKIQAAVENVRFEESIPEALKRVEVLSPSRFVFDPLSLSIPNGIVMPAMKIRQFRFTGSTKRTT